jgi:hypothetical protein
MNAWGPKPVFSLAVVTQDWKYIFWPYAADDFHVAEELYCTRNDPLELVNLAAAATRADELEQLRTVYDAAVAQWRAQAVPYHGYAELGPFFDRSLPWERKAAPKHSKRKRTQHERPVAE